MVDRLPADAAESLTYRLVGLQSIRPLPLTEVADRHAREGWEGAARRTNGDCIPLAGEVDPRRQARGLAPVADGLRAQGERRPYLPVFVQAAMAAPSKEFFLQHAPPLVLRPPRRHPRSGRVLCNLRQGFRSRSEEHTSELQ